MNKNLCIFRQNICYLRRSRNLSQKEMAGIMGIGVNTLRRIEQGNPCVRVNAGMLCQLCDYFDISADAILTIVFEEQFP